MMWKYSKWIECYYKLKSFKDNALHAHIKRCCVLNYGDEIDLCKPFLRPKTLKYVSYIY